MCLWGKLDFSAAFLDTWLTDVDIHMLVLNILCWPGLQQLITVRILLWTGCVEGSPYYSTYPRATTMQANHIRQWRHNERTNKQAHPKGDTLQGQPQVRETQQETRQCKVCGSMNPQKWRCTTKNGDRKWGWVAEARGNIKTLWMVLPWEGHYQREHIPGGCTIFINCTVKPPWRNHHSHQGRKQNAPRGHCQCKMIEEPQQLGYKPDGITCCTDHEIQMWSKQPYQAWNPDRRNTTWSQETWRRPKAMLQMPDYWSRAHSSNMQGKQNLLQLCKGPHDWRLQSHTKWIQMRHMQERWKTCWLCSIK